MRRAASKRSSGSARSGRTTRPGGRRATSRPGGKPRTPASGAATGASGRRRRAHLTSRAAILVIVLFAIVLSLAYPVREYIVQRRQIAELQAQEQEIREQIAALEARKRQLNDPNYIKREARRRLHYCMPGETCYVVVGRDDADGAGGTEAAKKGARPWYVTLWKSVEATDRTRDRGS